MAKAKTADLDELPAITLQDSPGDTFGIEPNIETEDQAELALHLMGFYSDYAAVVQGSTAALIKRIQERGNQRCTIEIEKQPIGCGARHAQLLAALERYTEEQRPELKNADGDRTPRSAKLSHGKIGWRRGRAAVQVCEGKNQSDVKAALEKHSASETKPGIAVQLQKLAAKARIFFDDKRKLFVDQLFTVSVALNVTKARDAFEKKELTRDDLKRLHLRYNEGDDEFFAEPAKFTPSRSAAPSSH